MKFNQRNRLNYNIRVQSAKPESGKVYRSNDLVSSTNELKILKETKKHIN